MLAAGFMADTDIPRATFIGYTTALVPSSDGPDFMFATLAIAAIPGIKVGDFCLVFVTSPSFPRYGALASGTAGAWPQDNYVWTPGYGYRTSVFRKVLDADDIRIGTFGLTYAPSAAAVAVVYRGATSAVRKVISQDDDHDDTQTVPGFTRAANCVGVVCAMTDRDVDATDFGVSVGWTERMNATLSAWRFDIADALAATDYVDGASIVWSNLGTSGPWAQVVQVYELRS